MNAWSRELLLKAVAKATNRAYRPPDPPKPVPPDLWPRWARWVAKSRQPEDAGVGDTIHREIGVHGEAFKAALKAVGLKCGCDERRRVYNLKYPYAENGGG